MNVRLKWNQVQAGQSAELFSGHFRSKGWRWRPFSTSVCIHVAVVWAGVNLHFGSSPMHHFVPQMQQARVLDLSMTPILERHAPVAPVLDPDRTASRPAGEITKEPARHESSRTAAAKRLEASNAPAAPAPARVLATREFRLPPMRKSATVTQTLIQLEMPPVLEIRQQHRFPALIILSALPRKLAPKPFVAPPERKHTMDIPSQVAIEMRPPILEVRAGHAKTPAILSETMPRLPIPAGATAPVASNREPVEAKPFASTITREVEAEPANIISLPDRPIPASSTMVLPPLNQLSVRDTNAGMAGTQEGIGGRTQAGKSGQGASRWAAPAPDNSVGGNSAGVSGGNGAGVGNTGSNSISHAQGAGSGAGHGGSSAAGGTAGGPGKSAGGASGGNASGGGEGGAGNGGHSETGGSGGRASSVPAKPPRIVKPRDGRYEVAVVQTSGLIPGSSGLLKGRPVYSVYLSVGMVKEWILQYCVPPDTNRRLASTQVVQLGAVTPFAAPFAFTVVTPVVQFRAGARYAFIHGFVDASGHFEQLTEAGEPVLENLGALIEILEQWEFRPASKDGQPALVEILLCIPNAA